MTIKLCIRMGAAMHTAALWMTIFLLLQHMGQHPSFTAKAEGSVIVSITKYFSIDNSVFATNFSGRIDFSNSAQACRVLGGLLTADQTPAAHQSISDYMRQIVPSGTVHTFMGADYMYSVNREPDPVKKCSRGVTAASLNCLYQWNMGFFTSEETDGLGVTFYRGSLYSLPGAGPVNGYEPYWDENYPAHGQAFLISRMTLTTQSAVWIDGLGLADNNPESPSSSYVVVCAVQDGYVINSTTLAPVVVLSWAQKYWYVILIVVLVPVLIAVLLLILCLCCFVGSDESKCVVPMVLRELNGAPLYASGGGEGIIDDVDDNDINNRSLIGDPGGISMPQQPLMSRHLFHEDEEPQANPVVVSREDVVYHDSNVFKE